MQQKITLNFIHRTKKELENINTGQSQKKQFYYQQVHYYENGKQVIERLYEKDIISSIN